MGARSDWHASNKGQRANDKGQSSVGSSVARTPLCQGGGPGFDPRPAHFVVVQTFQSAPCRLENLHHNGGSIPVAVTQTAECRSSKPDVVGSKPTRCIGDLRFAIADLRLKKRSVPAIPAFKSQIASVGPRSGQSAIANLLHAVVAQLAEQSPRKRPVAGSRPARGPLAFHSSTGA